MTTQKTLHFEGQELALQTNHPLPELTPPAFQSPAELHAWYSQTLSKLGDHYSQSLADIKALSDDPEKDPSPCAFFGMMLCEIPEEGNRVKVNSVNILVGSANLMAAGIDGLACENEYFARVIRTAVLR